MSNPPNWAMVTLHWLVPDELIEGIAGDLLEQFDSDLEQGLTKRRANARFMMSVLRLIHPIILLRHQKLKQYNQMGMIKSHLKVAVRSMRRQKFYTTVNVLGLSMAIAFTYLIFLFLQTELSYDQFHSNGDQIYRVYNEISRKESGELIAARAVLSAPLLEDIKREVPGIKHGSRYGSSAMTVVSHQQAYQETVCFVDADFFKMFDFPIISGAAFQDEGKQMMLSEEQAKKYFGEIDPIGQTVNLKVGDSLRSFEVIAVYQDKNDQSSIPLPMVLPFEQMALATGEEALKSYNYGVVESYVEWEAPDVSEGISPLLTSSLDQVLFDEEVLIEMGIQPLRKLHFEKEITGYARYTDASRLWIMLGLALLVLVVATINFITLSTGHALSRLKEMGLRKSLGAFKGQLRIQLVIESVLLSSFSGVVGLGLAYLLTPFFAQLLEVQLHFEIGMNGVMVLVFAILSISLITGLLQGGVLLREDVIKALKGSIDLRGKESWTNRTLVVLQFGLAIVLILGATFLREQLLFLQNKDLGFDKERLVEISMNVGDSEQRADNLLTRLEQSLIASPAIQGVTASMNNAREPWTKLHFLQEDESTEELHFNLIDEQYLEVMNVEVVQGRAFDPKSNPSNVIMVNEALVKHFGWEDPLSEQIPGRNFEQPHQIIGVVKDFHFSSLHNEIEPLILSLNTESVVSGVTGLTTYIWPPNFYEILVKVGPGDLSESMTMIEEAWSEVNPNEPFNSRFYDQMVDQQYAEEQRWGQMIDTASIFSLIIAWLGLIGLTRMSMQRRIKEIGIKKVLGSPMWRVTAEMSQRYLILVLMASAMAVPISWYFVDQWLESFSYRISVSALWFVLAPLGVLSVTLLSVGFQSYRAASINPVKTLKCE